MINCNVRQLPLFFIIILGPNQLVIAATLIPLVYIVHVIFFPIAYPISLALDYFLGHDGGITLYNRKEIATMMTIQHEEVLNKLSANSDQILTKLSNHKWR